MKNNWIEKLRKQDACWEAIDWASDYKTPQAAWNACEDAEWMLWAWDRNCGKIGSKSHKKMILCCVEIAKNSVKYIKNKEVKMLVKKSLKTTERWASGEKSVTLEDVKNAAYAARYPNAAGYAAYAARSARYAAWAAAGAADAWDAAGYAADAAGYAADAKKKKYAKMIRTIQPLCPKFR